MTGAIGNLVAIAVFGFSVGAYSGSALLGFGAACGLWVLMPYEPRR